MNCLEFRRLLTVDPAGQGPDMLRHRRECSACAAFAERMSQFEHTLGEAVKITVPDDLASGILLRQSMGVDRAERTRRARWLALAASLLLTVGLVSGLWVVNYPYSLDAVVLAHVNGELHHLEDRNNVRLAQLNDMLRPFNTQLRRDIGPIHYAGSCRMRKYAGAHMVLEGDKGPVTVLLMPGEYVGDRTPVQDRRFSGIIVPVDNGSMAIVGERGEALGGIERRMRSATSVVF